ncbi:protein translocase subunit SecF [Candidatus Woesearchaeota archaeon]|nr:protein translocase subunit SecF [Candidatus Woesearchaeota archaeon]
MSRRERKLLRKKGKKYRPDRTIDEHPEKQHEQAPLKKGHSKLIDFYGRNCKKAMWFTVSLLVIAIIIIIVQTARTGEFIPRGVSLKGGVTITVPYDSPVDTDILQTQLKGDFPQASISVRAMSSAGETIGFIVDASDADPEALLDAVKSHTSQFDKFSMETMGSALGNAFFKQTLFAILIAFVLMSIVVFLAFKTFVPSFAVILSAVTDITLTVATINVFGIRVETAGIAALLMLIGYSVDTDILLTTRVVKREGGTVLDRTIDAMKTGLTMTLTSLAAVTVALIFTQSETLRQIMIILLIGLVYDILSTWIQNAGILMIYMEKRAKKQTAATLAEFGEKAEEADFEDIDEDDSGEEEPDEPEEEPEKPKHEHAHERAAEHKTESHPHAHHESGAHTHTHTHTEHKK